MPVERREKIGTLRAATRSCDLVSALYVQFKSINILLGSDDDNEVFIHFSSDNSSATS